MDIDDKHLGFYLVAFSLDFHDITKMWSAKSSLSGCRTSAGLFFFHNNPAKSMRREGRPFKQEALQLTLTCYD